MKRLRVWICLSLFCCVGVSATTPQAILDSTWNPPSYFDAVFSPDVGLVALFSNGMDVFQTSVSSPPEKLGSLAFGFTKSNQVLLAGTTAYVIRDQSVVVVDLSETQTPRVVSKLPVGGVRGFLHETKLYLFNKTISVLDLSDRNAPLLEAQYEHDGVPATGFVIDGRILTVHPSRGARTFEILANGQLQLVSSYQANRFTRADNTLLLGRRLFLAGTDIDAIDLDPDGHLTHRGTFEGNMLIRDLEIVEGHLIAAVATHEFAGLLLVKLDEDMLFESSFQLSLTDFQRITTVDKQQFFGISSQGDLNQYRPETSFSRTAVIEAAPKILDVAFNGENAFVASENLLRVIRFANETGAQVTATLPGLIDEEQRLQVSDDVLHHASQTAYRQYRMTHGDQLELLKEVALSLKDPLLAMAVEGTTIKIATRDQVALLDGSLEATPAPIRLLDFPIGRAEQVVMRKDTIFTQRFTELRSFEMTPENSLRLRTTQSLVGGQGFVPYPMTQNENLLIVGGQIFDARFPQALREIDRDNYNFESAILSDDSLFTIGEQGFQIWDFQVPNRPQILWEAPEVQGDKVLLAGDKALVFQANPTFISRFTIQRDDTEWLVPLVRNDPFYASQLIFFNSDAKTVHAHLTATDNQESQVEKTLTLQPGETQIIPATDLVASGLAFNLKIRAPRSLLTSITTRQATKSLQNASDGQTRALRVDELNRRAVLNLVNPRDDGFIAISQGDDGPPLSVSVRVFTNESPPKTFILLARGPGPMILPLSEFSTDDGSAQSATILVEAAEDRKIGAMIQSEGATGKPGLNLSHAGIQSGPNPIHLKTVNQFGSKASYRSMTLSGDRLTLAGPSGIRSITPNNAADPLTVEADVKDAEVVGNLLWVLTDEGVEGRSLASGEILTALELKEPVFELVQGGDYLFLFGFPLETILVVNIAEPLRPTLAHILFTQGFRPVDVAWAQDQLLVATDNGLIAFDQLDQAHPRFLGRPPIGLDLRKIFAGENVVYAASRDQIAIFQVQPGSVPVLVDRVTVSGNLVAMDQDRGLVVDSNEDRIEIFDLNHFEPLGSLSFDPDFRLFEGRLSGDQLWVRNNENRIQLFDIQDLEAPKLLLDQDSRTHISNLALDGTVALATERQDRQILLHQISLADEAFQVETVNLGDGFPQAIVKRGNFAYIADRVLGLVTVSLEGDTPTLVGSVGNSADRIALSEDLVITSGLGGLVSIFDLENPANPLPLGTLGADCCPLGLAIAGNLAFVTERIFGLRIVDFSNPRSPQLVGELATSERVLNSLTGDVLVHNGIAYLGESQGVAVVDVGDPSQPVLLTRTKAGGPALHRQENTLFVGDGSAIRTYDISDPAQPRLQGETRGFRVTQFATSGNNLWLADGSSLQRLTWQPQLTTVPWAVNNSAYQTHIQLSNPSGEPVDVQLLALDPKGKSEAIQLQIPSRSDNTHSVADLFPELNGYAIALETDSTQIASSFATYSLKNGSTLSGPALATALPNTGLRDGLVLSYPSSQATAAIVVQAPFNQGRLSVVLKLYAPEGFLAETTLELQGRQPYAKLLHQLFAIDFLGTTQTITLESKDGTLLTGATFAFVKGQPTTAEGFSRPAIYLNP